MAKSSKQTNWKLISTRKDGISTYRLKSWQNYQEFIDTFFKEYNKYIFRGHRDVNWRLQPTFDRLFPIDSQDYSTKRQNHLKQFIKYAQGRLKIEQNLQNKTDNDWWAIGQHFGLATPLLDWTESPFIAAYFAFEVESNPAADRIIYCISTSYIEKYSDKKIELFYTQNDGNPRLINQRGLFTCISDKIDIEQHIKDNFPFKDKQDALIKIIIPESKSTRVDFLKSLNRMNINHLTLFPDMTGACNYSNKMLLIENY